MPVNLFLVPTPIGNLSDMTFRAIEVLREADLILAEDTRTSGTLLKHFEIATPMKSFHLHNEHKQTAYFVQLMQEGKTLALISDAGSPGISDPGFLLVREAVDAGLEVQALPGATAFVPALTISGFPCDRFVFEGFLPHKKGKKTRIESILDEERTVVYYESPHRIARTLDQMKEILGPERKVAVVREISKKFEEVNRGSLEEMAKHYTETPAKGEFVLVVAGASS